MRLPLAQMLPILAATGCAAVIEPVIPPPQPRPVAAAPAPAPVASEESRELSAHFRRVETVRRAQGRLRPGTDDPGQSLDPEALIRNFMRIAFFEELTEEGGQLIGREREGRLRRWDRPVRIGLTFEGAVPAGQKASDRISVATYADRLARITGHPIAVAGDRANFHVLIVDEDARKTIGPLLRDTFPEMSGGVIEEIRNLPRSIYCLVAASDPDGDGTYSAAVAIIRSEQPDLMRLSCLHEEIAQGMGLANDSPEARPSIFNDDGEFATLTRQDELLLRILYDRRLTPGMDAATALPIVREIVAGMVAGPS